MSGRGSQADLTAGKSDFRFSAKRRHPGATILHSSCPGLTWLDPGIHAFEGTGYQVLQLKASACRDPIWKARGQLSDLIKLASIRIWLPANRSAPAKFL